MYMKHSNSLAHSIFIGRFVFYNLFLFRHCYEVPKKLFLVIQMIKMIAKRNIKNNSDNVTKKKAIAIFAFL